MKRLLSRLILGLVCSSFLTGQTAADAVRLFELEEGPASTVLGRAGLALDGGISALYWNPAGIGTITTAVFSAALSQGSVSNSVAYLGNSQSSRESFTRLDGAGFLFPLKVRRGALVLGFAYNHLADFDENTSFRGFSDLSNGLNFDIDPGTGTAVNYLFDKNVNREEAIRINGGIHQWAAGFSIATSPATLFGVSLALNRGSEDYHFRFTQTDATDQYSVYPEDFESYDVRRFLNSSLTALTLNLGGQLRLGKYLRLGGTITLPVAYDIDETYSSESTLTFDDGFETKFTDAGKWSYGVKSPVRFTGGFAFTTNRIRLAGSLRYRDFSQVEYNLDRIDVDDENYFDMVEQNEILWANYGPVTDINLGAELILMPGRLSIQSGHSFQPPALNGSPDHAGRQLVSGGFRVQPDRLVDLVFTIAKTTWERSSVDEFTPAGTSEELSKVKVTFGIEYRLGGK